MYGIYEVKVKDHNGKEIDIAVELRFAKDTMEVNIDETPEVIQRLAENEFIFIEILTPKGMFGQSRIAEFEISVIYYKGNQSCRVNSIVTR